MDYKSPGASPKTINGTYQPVTAHLSKCRTDGFDDILKFRAELLDVTTEPQARRTLMQISAACKWGRKHKLIPENLFDGMYKELDASEPPPPIAFTVEEALLHEGGLRKGRHMVSFNYHTKTCHETSIPHPQLV